MNISNLGQSEAFLSNLKVSKTTSNALDTPYFRQGTWPTLNWWEAFEDKELGDLINQAIKNNPDIQAIRQKVIIARQMAIKSKAGLFPSIFFDSSERWSHLSLNDYDHLLNPSLSRNIDRIVLNFGFDYEFDFWAKYTNLFRAARGRAQAEMAELNQTKLITSIAIAQAYFSLKAYSVEKILCEEWCEIQKKALGLANLLYSKALYSKIPPATYKQDYDFSLKMMYELEKQVANSKHLVNILRGESPDAPLNINIRLDPVPKSVEIPKDLSSDLMIRRPDLLAAIWRVEAACYDVNVAIADFFPRINLRGLIGVESVGWKHLANWQSGAMSLLPSIYIPIFKAGEIRANLKMKRAELEKAIDDYNALLLKSLQEITDTIVLTTQWYETKVAQENIVKEAKLKLNLVALREKRGIDNLLQVYLEEINKIRKQMEEVRVTFNQYIAVINLIKSLGGGYTNEDMRRLKIQGIE